MRFGARTFLASILLLLPLAAQSAEWPGQPIRLVVTFPPGGSSDIVARLVSGPLAEKLGQTVVVDNRSGGGGTIGGAAVATAKPDGYTLMLSNTTPISISPFMLEKQTYDPARAFTHIFYIGSVPNIFVVHPSVPARSMKELVALLRSPAKPVSYGSGGIGSIGHIIGELFKNDTGAKMEHIGYKGSAPMHNDLLGGQIDLAIDTLPQNVPYVQAGKLRGIAVTSSKRAPMTPNLPTVVELGLPKLVAENFLGVSGPAGIPRPVVDRVHAAMKEIIIRPEIVKRLEELGVQGAAMSSTEFDSFVQKQVRDWSGPVRSSGAKLN
jgi:tripartite-type tricarboxylate transporter receptor subunit TctC